MAGWTNETLKFKLSKPISTEDSIEDNFDMFINQHKNRLHLTQTNEMLSTGDSIANDFDIILMINKWSLWTYIPSRTKILSIVDSIANGWHISMITTEVANLQLYLTSLKKLIYTGCEWPLRKKKSEKKLRQQK